MEAAEKQQTAPELCGVVWNAVAIVISSPLLFLITDSLCRHPFISFHSFPACKIVTDNIIRFDLSTHTGARACTNNL